MAATTIDQLAELGYQTGVAHGDVAVEQAALDAALADASPEVVVARANKVTADSLQQIASAGKLPVEAADRRNLAEQIAAAALETLTVHADDEVEFRRRALAHAQSVPTVWHVAGEGVALYVAVDDATGSGADEAAQDLLDSLAAAARTA